MAIEAPGPLGQRIKRVEDPKFITGNGRYLDDIQLQGMVHLAILRSPYAHANIRSIDTSRAKEMPGVIAVFTGEDIPYNPLTFAWPAAGTGLDLGPDRRRIGRRPGAGPADRRLALAPGAPSAQRGAPGR